MEALILTIQIVLPASLVMFVMYLTIKTFLQKEFEKKAVEIKLKNRELIVPVRLQAYERICLLLERISPANLIPRVNQPDFASGFLHARLLSEVRDELNHNAAQQVYMSDQAWELTKHAIQEVTTIINHTAQNVNPESKSIELVKAIFDHMVQKEDDAIAAALTFVKNEIRSLY